jgi:hypothetical protein
MSDRVIGTAVGPSSVALGRPRLGRPGGLGFAMRRTSRRAAAAGCGLWVAAAAAGRARWPTGGKRPPTSRRRPLSLLCKRPLSPLQETALSSARDSSLLCKRPLSPLQETALSSARDRSLLCRRPLSPLQGTALSSAGDRSLLCKRPLSPLQETALSSAGDSSLLCKRPLSPLQETALSSARDSSLLSARDVRRPTGGKRPPADARGAGPRSAPSAVLACSLITNE